MNCLVNQPNPFLSGYLPLFEQIDINAMGYKTIEQQIKTQTDEFKDFELNLNKQEYNFKDIFDTLDVIQYPLSRTYGIISHLSGVNDSKSIRDIKDHFRSDIVELGKLSSHSKVLYNAIKKIRTNDEDEKRVIKLTVEGMERGGVNLPKEDKDTLTAIDKILSEQYFDNTSSSCSSLQLCSKSVYNCGTGPIVGPHKKPPARTNTFRPIYCSDNS